MADGPPLHLALAKPPSREISFTGAAESGYVCGYKVNLSSFVLPVFHLEKRRLSPAGERAFSLVEVVLAIGVVAFAFIAIMGLIPAGLNQFRKAMDTTVCAQIAQRVINEAQETDFNILIDQANLPPTANFTFRAPAVQAPAPRYFDDQGSEIVPKAKVLSADEKAAIIYWVNMRVMPQTALPKTNTGPDSPHVATLTLQVAFNPGNRDIPVSASDPSDTTARERNLYVSTPGISVLTFSAVIGRNR